MHFFSIKKQNIKISPNICFNYHFFHYFTWRIFNGLLALNRLFSKFRLLPTANSWIQWKPWPSSYQLFWFDRNQLTILEWIHIALINIYWFRVAWCMAHSWILPHPELSWQSLWACFQHQLHHPPSCNDIGEDSPAASWVILSLIRRSAKSLYGLAALNQSFFLDWRSAIIASWVAAWIGW